MHTERQSRFCFPTSPRRPSGLLEHVFFFFFFRHRRARCRVHRPYSCAVPTVCAFFSRLSRRHLSSRASAGTPMVGLPRGPPSRDLQRRREKKKKQRSCAFFSKESSRPPANRTNRKHPPGYEKRKRKRGYGNHHTGTRPDSFWTVAVPPNTHIHGIVTCPLLPPSLLQWHARSFCLITSR